MRVEGSVVGVGRWVRLLCAVVVLGLVGALTPVSPAVAQSCSVAGRSGVESEWLSTGSDLVADRVEAEFGVVLAVLEPAFRWEVPVCVASTGGDVGLAGPIVRVESVDAGAFETAALNDALVLLMAASYKPEPLLSPARGEVQWAGLESWLAVDPGGFVPLPAVTGSAGGVDVTASAVPVGTVWTFVDGTVVECLGPGELYVAGGPEDAPCGKEWEHTSAVQNHGVQVAVRYDVSWSSSLGASGSLSRVGGSLGAYKLFVDELQAVGVYGDRERPVMVGLPSAQVGVTADCSLAEYAAGECDDPVADGDDEEEVDDGECGALTGPLRDLISGGGEKADEAIAAIEQWAKDSGVTETAIGIRDWFADKGRRAAGWVNDNVVGHVVDAGKWVYAQGAEALSQYKDEIRWVQGAAGELWGVVDGAVVATASGVIDAGGVVFQGAVNLADAAVQDFKQDLGTLRDGAEMLADAVASTGVGEHLGVGIEILEGAGDVAVAVGECIVWIGAETYAAIPDVLKNLPILGGLSLENLVGCGKALGGRVADIAGLVQMVAGAAANPAEAAAEAEEAIRGLIQAVIDDPAGVALQFGKDLSHYHLLEEGKRGQWVGAIACEIAMEVGLAIVTGGVYTAARTGTFGPKIAGIITKLDNLMPSSVIRRLLDRDGGRIELDARNDAVQEVFPSCKKNNSFPGSTSVLLGDGSFRVISEIDVGDVVVSYDEHVGAWNTNLVTDVWSAVHTDPLVAVAVAGGGFTSTADHLVWEVGGSQWVEAEELVVGDSLLTPTGPVKVLSTAGGVVGDGIVWDITVANDHNFLVSNPATGPPVLVHNCGNLVEVEDANGDVVAIEEVDPSTGRVTRRLDEDGTVTEFLEDGSAVEVKPDGTEFRITADGRRFLKVSDDLELPAGDWTKAQRATIKAGTELKELDSVDLRVVDRALDGYQKLDIEVDGQRILVERADMRRILSRHHPQYSNLDGAGLTKPRLRNSAFDASTTPESLKSMIDDIVRTGTNVGGDEGLMMRKTIDGLVYEVFVDTRTGHINHLTPRVDLEPGDY